jgi:GLPGLI family protein
MKKIIFLYILSFLSLTTNGQNIRAAYSFYYKTDISQNKHHVQSDMMLDWCPTHSVFYNDANFHKDSLSVIAFDEDGSIKDTEAYQKIFDYRGGASKDAIFIDFTTYKYRISYRLATVYLSGEGIIEVPKWNFLPDSTITSTGFHVKKAVAEYLGRTWVVWYCEDIPISAGPWLLWGTPGLIIHAHDSEGIFHFKLLDIQLFNSAIRYEQIYDYCFSPKIRMVHKYTYGIDKAEQVHNRMMRDLDFLFSMAGESQSKITIVDKKGESAIINSSRDYIPLITDNYWK